MKKLLSIILAILMIVTTVPFAFAVDTVTVYLKNTAGWRSTIYIYGWNEDTAARPLGEWPGTAMNAVEGEDGLYTFDVPADLVGIIFNDASNQTADLTLPTDGENCYDCGSGQWTTFTADNGEADEVPEIKLGETYTPDEEEYVKFVPTVSDTFIIRSVSDVDPRVTLYNADFVQLAEEDDSSYREENNCDFYLEYEYIAGETYYFKFFDYQNAYNYTVIFECKMHTGGTQTCGGYKCESCDQWYDEGTGAHTGGTQICGGYQCEVCGMFYGEGTGEHIDEDGDLLCDLCDTPIFREIKPGDTYTVTNVEYVKFLPTISGIYVILSISDVDPRVKLYNSNMEHITEEDDSGYREENYRDFYLEYEYTAGETYYFEFYDYNGEYNYTVTIIEPCSVHTGGTQTCKGFKCEVCMQWYGEAGEHTAEGEQTCLGIFCSVCGEYFGEVSEHDLSSEQTCLGYYCYSCAHYYGEADPDAHNWNDTYCNICYEEHDHIGSTQTCRGYKCEVCGCWYGEAGEQHDLSTEQTCKGYRCNLCYDYFGEKSEHVSDTEQTCMGYRCKYCYEWFGEADTSKHNWYYGYCDYCDAEYPEDAECTHEWNADVGCEICGEKCAHENIENETCTNCSYALPFSLTTGETVTYHGSFPDALDKAEDGSIIKLLKDYDDYNSVEINKEITLDLNGKEWIQPSSGGFSVTANATFTDSVGGGYLDYSLYLYSPITFSGGTYRYIEINFETEDTIGDYLADCCACFDRYTDEIIDVDDAKDVLGATIKADHNLGEQTCKGYKCDACSEYFGETLPHDWSNLDGICAYGCGKICIHENYTDSVCDECGYNCPHENYTKGVCDVCNYVCFHSFTEFTETVAPKCEETGWEESYCDYGCGIKLEQEIPALEHDWVSGGIERPVQNIDGSWSDGYYYDTCKNDATHINITGVAKRADYTAYNEAYKALKTEQKNEALTDAGAASVNQAVMTGMTMPQNIIEDEPTTAYLNNWVKNAQSILAKIESGEYVKADYSEIDEAIKAVDEALENATISEEMKAELEDIKADLEALKENASATMADVNALLDRAEAITETMNNCVNGVHSFTTYEEITAPECGVAGLEEATCDNGCGATDEREIPTTSHKAHEDYSYDYTGHWKDCVYGCGTEIEGTRQLHTYTWEVITEATETTPGEEKGTCVCGWYDIREIPATGETESDTCDHLCHKDGILGFFWKIISFFHKLFGIQQYCDCGVLHYDNPIFG